MLDGPDVGALGDTALGNEVFHDRADGLGIVHAAVLEALEAGVHAAPTRAHEVDQEREIVHAGMPLGEKIAFETLEAADRLVEEPSDLGDVPGDRQDLGPESVAYRVADPCRDRLLELCGARRQRLDLRLRTLERRFEERRLRTAGRRVRNAPLRPIESEIVHGGRGYSQRRMDTSILDYELPPELIAQHPCEPRDASRLFVYRRHTNEIEHTVFAELPDLLDGELVVVNDTRVFPARLRLRRADGGEVEILLLERLGADGLWEGLARPARRLRAGERLGPVELRERLGEGRWLLRLEGEPRGEAPLPPYINEPLADPDRYQTVYARDAGSAAAPTAGLHFTPELLARLEPERVTLHIGLDTFRPVTVARLEEHALHGERYHVAAAAWDRVARAERVLAVGTTTVRVLETVALTGELDGRTRLFVTPGFAFRRVDALLTNFHLPRSTLLALVMAFVGVERTLELYRQAVAERYRFYSFGDAMIVL